MRNQKIRPKIPMRSALDLAIGAIEGNRSSLDMPVVGVDPSPGALDRSSKKL